MSENQNSDKDNDRTQSMGDFSEGQDRPRIRKLGHFRIDATLGSGGMGTIYRAYDESMKRPVALKVLHSSLEISERAQTRFVREAWIAGQLEHPNIIKVHSRGEENNVSYLAMELADGGSLSDFIKQTQEQVPSGSDITGTVDREYINNILGKFIELAGALEHIHSKGFIHRDIKPQNILLSGAEKKFKLTDFGIAHADDMTRMTAAGDFIGTVRYMSPELLAAHRGGIDKRTDIYSLGVTLYEALTLTLPFKADSEEKLIGEILAGHYIEARKSNRRIPFDLETVLMKACHHDPSLRYQNADEFADDLQRIIDDRPILAKRQSALSKGIKYIRRNYKAASIISISAVVVLVGFLGLFYSMQKAGYEEMSIRKVWSDSEVRAVHLGSISPNGRDVSMTISGELGILELANKKTRALTNSWAGFAAVDTMPEGRRKNYTDSLLRYGRMNFGSIWSPDGNQLAYAWLDLYMEKGDLHLVGRDGTDAKVLMASENERVKRVIPYDWSTDGKQILAGGVTEDDVVRLLSISTVDGSAKEIDTIDLLAPLPGFGRCYLSPDNRYATYTSSEYDILLLSVDGNVSKPLVKHSARDYVLGWSPDGKWVCFASDRSGTMDIWIIGVHDGKPQGEAQKISRNIGEIISLGITDEGPLYFGLDAGITDIYVTAIVPETGMLSESVEKVSLPFDGTNDWPEWSPDGKRLLYQSNRKVGYDPGARSPLCTYSTETGESQETRVRLEEFWGHQYSPDGRFAITCGVDIAGQRGLFQIDLESGAATPLVKWEWADLVDLTFLAWSLYGDKLYYVAYGTREDDPTRLMQYDLETEHEKELAREGFWINYPALSPDGQWLVYQTLDMETARRVLKILPAHGGPIQRIVTLDEDEHAHAIDWMPDGESIMYIKGFLSNRKQRELWQVFIDDRSPRRIGGFEGMSRLSIHPDGRQIAFSASERQTQIWVMENFLPED